MKDETHLNQLERILIFCQKLKNIQIINDPNHLISIHKPTKMPLINKTTVRSFMLLRLFHRKLDIILISYR